VRLLEAPSFGQATNTVTPGRRLQVSLKYPFVGPQEAFARRATLAKQLDQTSHRVMVEQKLGEALSDIVNQFRNRAASKSLR
jgi:hypothetical protein